MKKLIILISLTYTLNATAGDLDDGIIADTPINDDIKLDTNVEFIVRKAKSAAAQYKDGKNPGNKVFVNDGCGGTGNQNFGAGSNLKGATIVNLSDNKGADTVCKK
jgi:hypothetical protein